MEPGCIPNFSASCYLKKVCLPQGQNQVLVHFITISWELTEILPRSVGNATCLFKALILFMLYANQVKQDFTELL